MESGSSLAALGLAVDLLEHGRTNQQHSDSDERTGNRIGQEDHGVTTGDDECLTHIALENGGQHVGQQHGGNRDTGLLEEVADLRLPGRA